MRLQRDTHQFVYSILVLLLGMLFAVNGGPCYGQAVAIDPSDPSFIPLTKTEQAGRLAGLLRSPFGLNRTLPRTTDSLNLFMQTIIDAQQGENINIFRLRRPVPLSDLESLSKQLGWSLDKTAATTDYIHTLMRESKINDLESLTAKLERGFYTSRKPLHGTIAELPEAREQNSVLTKDIHSKTFDLTSPEIHPPRSYQQKVFKNARAGLKSLKKDLENIPKRSRHGFLPGDSIDELVKKDLLENRTTLNGNPIYRTTDGSRITVFRMKSFKSAQESQAYYIRGKKGAAELLPSEGAMTKIAKFGGGALELTGSAIIGWDAYNQSVEAWNMFYDPTLNGSILPYMQSAYAVSEWGMAGTLFLDLASQWDMLGEIGGLRIAGELAGKWFVPVAVVTEVLSIGVDTTKYFVGRSTAKEFGRNMSGHGVVVGFAAGGAAIGSWGLGVGAIPGAAIGFILGGVADAGMHIYWWYTDREESKEFNEEQQRAFNEALDERYGLN